jgi:hypothetical protein
MTPMRFRGLRGDARRRQQARNDGLPDQSIDGDRRERDA